VEFLNSTNLEILNQGNDPTFCNGLRLKVIDIALRSYGLLGTVKSWEVSSEPSLLDHRHVLFTGLLTGMSNQEHQRHHMGLFLGEPEGQTGEVP